MNRCVYIYIWQAGKNIYLAYIFGGLNNWILTIKFYSSNGHLFMSLFTNKQRKGNSVNCSIYCFIEAYKNYLKEFTKKIILRYKMIIWEF